MPCESAAVRSCSLGAWPRPPGRRQLGGVHPLARRLKALAPKPLEITPPCGGPDQRRLLKPEGTLSNGEAHGELTSAGMRCARDLGAESASIKAGLLGPHVSRGDTGHNPVPDLLPRPVELRDVLARIHETKGDEPHPAPAGDRRIWALRAACWPSLNRSGRPGRGLSWRPSGPSALKRSTASRNA